MSLKLNVGLSKKLGLADYSSIVARGENLSISLVGVTDLMLPEPDGPLIADFKTTS
ncbi:MAG TPA: hypothetical protein VG056_10765 [Pirellulales bacterium]|jgi:hypothetical protein|nr:hypothetical protein [Pirellulales bacterium]